MRVAVCLSGQFRFVEECYPIIYKNIIEPNKADVFMHGWYSKNLENQIFTEQGETSIFFKGKLKAGVDKTAINLYKPINYLLEDQKNFSELTDGIDIRPYGTPALNQFSMFYSIYKSNELKKEHEKNNNFTYDAVVRVRYDFVPSEIFDFSKFDQSFLHCKGDCRHTSYCLNDHFAFSNSLNMDIYSDTFNHLRKYYFEDKEPFCPEVLLGYGLKYDNKRKLQIKTYNWNNKIKYERQS